MSEMAIKIWKAKLLKGNNEIFMPKGSVPLSVGVQHFQPTIWFRVPMGYESIAVGKNETFNIYGCETGKEYFMDDTDVFLGTTLTKDDAYVLSFFWLKGKSYPRE